MKAGIKKIIKYSAYLSGGVALLSIFFLGSDKDNHSDLSDLIVPSTAFAEDSSCATCDTCSTCSSDSCGGGGDGCGGGGGDDGDGGDGG